jgi:hypothetical protein
VKQITENLHHPPGISLPPAELLAGGVLFVFFTTGHLTGLTNEFEKSFCRLRRGPEAPAQG